ncbi:hypothetical protein LY78DRAFT_656490 [Colletotrichum sublineola]|nr:hypothetical protein LY78DRAFT_656490 [Colletotrichum sublineola]
MHPMLASPAAPPRYLLSYVIELAQARSFPFPTRIASADATCSPTLSYPTSSLLIGIFQLPFILSRPSPFLAATLRHSTTQIPTKQPTYVARVREKGDTARETLASRRITPPKPNGKTYEAATRHPFLCICSTLPRGPCHFTTLLHPTPSRRIASLRDHLVLSTFRLDHSTLRLPSSDVIVADPVVILLT